MKKKGAVSAEGAAAMCRGARERFGADYALSTTGIAGPTGGTPEKPVGTVYYGLSTPEVTIVRKNRFTSGREDHRKRSSQAALALLWLYSTDVYNKHPWADGSEEAYFDGR